MQMTVKTTCPYMSVHHLSNHKWSQHCMLVSLKKYDIANIYMKH